VKETELQVHVEDYGAEYTGVYKVRLLTWKYSRELLRRSIRNKDTTGYVEELILASVTPPADVEMKTREQLECLPAGLVRRLMDETLKLNDVSNEETAFLSSSATPAAASSQKTPA